VRVYRAVFGEVYRRFDDYWTPEVFVCGYLPPGDMCFIKSNEICALFIEMKVTQNFVQLTCSFLFIVLGPGVLRKDAAFDGPSAFSAEGGSSATISSSSLSSDVSAATGDAFGLDMILQLH
jgi:hypothetical protein